MISSRMISKGLVKPSLFYCTNSKMYFTKNTLITSFRSYSTEGSNPNNGPSKYKKRKIFSKVILITAATLLFISIKDYQETLNEDELIRPTSWPLYLYSRLPLNTVSRLWGQFNNMTLPVWLRGPGYKLYSYLFGANLNEILDPDLTHYKNLGEFFYRKIKPECRPIDETALLCSPSDGRVLKFGVVDDSGDIEQVKGMTYKIEALLGTIDSNKLATPSVSIEYPDSDQSFHHKFVEKLNNDPTKQQKLVHVENKGDKSMLHPSTSQVFQATRALTPTNTNNKLFYAVIYLAPGDYHRFHSPTTWVTTLRRHFVGELYSVAPYFQKTFSNLFVLNERVALLGYWKHGFFSMTPVGATNVGSIKINFDKDLVTNTSQLDGKKVKKNTCYEATYSNASQLLGGHPLLKGDEIGGFMLGSTVVLVFEAPENFEFDLQEGQNVKMGQKIGELVKK